MGTPIYHGVEAEQVEGIPRPGGEPPRHPDIYRELCEEFGRDVLASRDPPRTRSGSVPEQRRPPRES
jgi:hypothetical protein